MSAPPWWIRVGTFIITDCQMGPCRNRVTSLSRRGFDDCLIAARGRPWHYNYCLYSATHLSQLLHKVPDDPYGT